VLTGSLFAHFFRGSRTVLLRAKNVCTAKRNTPRIYNDHTLREVKQ